MITAAACFVGGIFFQKFYPVIGDQVVLKVQAGWAFVKKLLSTTPPAEK